MDHLPPRPTPTTSAWLLGPRLEPATAILPRPTPGRRPCVTPSTKTLTIPLSSQMKINQSSAFNLSVFGPPQPERLLQSHGLCKNSQGDVRGFRDLSLHKVEKKEQLSLILISGPFEIVTLTVLTVHSSKSFTYLFISPPAHSVVESSQGSHRSS